MKLDSAVKKCILSFFYFIVCCNQNESRPSYWPQVFRECKERIVKEYYVPSFREPGFPPPQRLLRKVFPSNPFNLKEIWSGSKARPKVALTFDACSTLRASRFDSAVADILNKTKTPATIFLGGKWVLDRPKDAVFLASIPFFEIGNHTYLHGHLTNVSEDRLYFELLWTQEIIFTVTGRIPAVFRPPYLESNRKVAEAAARLGLKTICGDLPSGDPDSNASKERLIDEIKYHVHNGSIIIMHINKGGKHTAEALPDIIQWLKNNGYELVTVGQLLEHD